MIELLEQPGISGLIVGLLHLHPRHWNQPKSVHVARTMRTLSDSCTHTGKEAAEELVDSGGEPVVAAVRRQVDLPADRDAVHVDLDEQPLVAGLDLGACSVMVVPVA